MQLNRHLILKALGDVDEAIIAKVLATSASADTVPRRNAKQNTSSSAGVDTRNVVAEKEEKRGDTTYVERQFGSFARSVRLPFEAKDERIDAKFKDGVLTIHLPKPPDMQKAVRRIEVKAQ